MAPAIRLRSNRRITADGNHNAFTGAAWFNGALYVAFRQGDGHVCDHGHLVVMRSRDEGRHFEIVHVARGQVDTRDADLYVAGNRLYLVGFEAHVGSGMSWTDDGLVWSPWTRYEGTSGWWLWKPRFFQGRHYCAGYGNFTEQTSTVAWFESDDGLHWQQQCLLREGADKPSECFLHFQPDGTAAMLMRRDAGTPLLLRGAPPYRTWQVTELAIPLSNPALWVVDDDIWIAGRWFLHSTPHLGVFRIENEKAELHLVLPSGGDCTYMGVAPHPMNRHLFFLSYYSGHMAPDDPDIDQWSHPDNDPYPADCGNDCALAELAPNVLVMSVRTDPNDQSHYEMAGTDFRVA